MKLWYLPFGAGVVLLIPLLVNLYDANDCQFIATPVSVEFSHVSTSVVRMPERQPTQGDQYSTVVSYKPSDMNGEDDDSVTEQVSSTELLDASDNEAAAAQEEVNELESQVDDLAYNPETFFPATGKQNLVVLSVGSGTGSWSLTEKNHAAYARHHRYGHARWIKPAPANIRDKWNKMLAIQDQFKRGVDIVLFVDADIVFTNFSVSATQVFKRYSGAETSLIVARDAATFDTKRSRKLRWLMNTGVMFLKDSLWSQNLLNHCLRQSVYLSRSRKKIQDQFCFMDYIKKYSPDVRMKPRHSLEQYDQVTFVPQTVMNKFYRHPSVLHQPRYHKLYKNFLKDPIDSIWQPGDWMAHLAGLSSRDKAEELAYLVEHAETWHPDTSRKTWAAKYNKKPRFIPENTKK